MTKTEALKMVDGLAVRHRVIGIVGDKPFDVMEKYLTPETAKLIINMIDSLEDLR